jgi:hypothetical protein
MEIRDSKGAPMPLRSDRCNNCDASLTSNQISIREMASEVVCGCLLLAVFILAGYAAYQCTDRQGQKLLDGPVGHEPLDLWSL